MTKIVKTRCVAMPSLMAACTLGGLELRSYFRRLWPKVGLHRIKVALGGVSVVCSAVFRLTMSCCVPEIGLGYSRSSRKVVRNGAEILMLFGRQISGGGEGPPKFLTEFYKFGAPSNMWQSLVRSAKLPRRLGGEKNKVLNDSSETEWP